MNPFNFLFQIYIETQRSESINKVVSKERNKFFYSILKQMNELNSNTLQLIKNGDNKPLGTIFMRHYDYCIKSLKKYEACTIEDAKDVYMDAVHVLRDKIIKGEYKDQNLKVFLYAIARNKLRNKRLKNKRYIQLDVYKVEAYLLKHKKNKSLDNSNLSEMQQRKVNVALKLLQQLNSNCHQLIYKHYYEGYPLAELQKELNYGSYGSIKSTINRCRKKLTITINQYFHKSKIE